MNAPDNVMEYMESFLKKLEKKKINEELNLELNENEEVEHAKKVLERENFKKNIGEMLFLGMERKILNSQEKNTTTKKESYEEPIEVGKKLYDIAETIKSTNLINRDVNAKYDAILEKLDLIADALIKSSERNLQLTTMDEQILDYAKEKGALCAEDVRKKFGYKGKNAASARLNSLHRKGLLKKTLVNKKVYYKIKNKNEPQ